MRKYTYLCKVFVWICVYKYYGMVWFMHCTSRQQAVVSESCVLNDFSPPLPPCSSLVMIYVSKLSFASRGWAASFGNLILGSSLLHSATNHATVIMRKPVDLANKAGTFCLKTVMSEGSSKGSYSYSELWIQASLQSCIQRCTLTSASHGSLDVRAEEKDGW